MNTFPNFYDVKLNNDFKKNGYVVVHFLNDVECDGLIDFYYKNEINSNEEFSTTIKGKNTRKKTFVSDYLCQKIDELLPQFIVGYQPLFANFLVKKPNSSYKVGIHQDWTYVDESKHRSFNIWIALCDTNDKNGGLRVLPKSHLLSLPIRYTPFDDNLKPFELLIKLKSKMVNVPKGYAVIYDSALIHYSNENKSNNTRYAFGCVCIPKKSTPYHYHLKWNKLYEYEINSSFFNSFNPLKKPDIKPKRIITQKRINKFNLVVSLLKL